MLANEIQRGEMPRGVALAVVDLVACWPMNYNDELPACCRVYPKAQSFRLASPRIIAPFPVKGALYLFDVELPEELEYVLGKAEK